MSTLIYSLLFEILGFVGLASVGIIPYRSWPILKTILKFNTQNTQSRTKATFLTILILTVIYTDVRVSLIAFNCLTKIYCGPNIATGWIYLATLGCIYLIFETIIFAINKSNRIHN